ncbi:MAG: DUF2723 domain-containing protein [Planctomycetota bacterium]|nr:DUF2723 domain-containing protein [Planctomycetota bacterium]
MHHRPVLLISITLFVAPLAIYVLTLAPTFVFADSAELALAATTGGVAHPPGFPLYLVLAGLFSHLPLGDDVAYRLNIFSALAAALTAPTIYLGLHLLLRSEVHRDDLESEIRLADHAPPATAALLFAFSLTFWQQATIVEVYTLNLAMTSFLFLLAAAHYRFCCMRAPRIWVIVVFGLVAGLGVANHLTLAFFLPGSGLLILLAPHQSRGQRIRSIGISVSAAVVVGLAAYSVLPIRAATDPILNWGDPDLGERFWRHITGWQFKTSFQPGWKTAWKQLGVFAHMGWTEFGPLPLILIGAGIIRLTKRGPTILICLALCFLIPFLWGLSYDIAEDQETYFLIPFLVLGILAGYGAARGMEAGSQRWPTRASRWGLAAAAILIGVSPLALNWSRSDRSLQMEARDYGLDLLETVQTDAVVFTRAWNLYAPTLYLQHIEGVRRDVDVIDLNLLRYSWYIPYLRQSAPRTLSGLDERIARFQRLQKIWERDELPAPDGHAELDSRYQRLIAGMLTEAWKANRPVYATRNIIFENHSDHPLSRCGVEFATPLPETIAFRILPPGKRTKFPDLSLRNRWVRASSDPISEKVREEYLVLWLNRGKYFEALGKPAQAAEAYQKADAIPPGSKAAREALTRLLR